MSTPPTPPPAATVPDRIAVAEALTRVLYSFMVNTVEGTSADPLLGDVTTAGKSAVPISNAAAATLSHALGKVAGAIEPWVQALADALIIVAAPLASKLLTVISQARTDGAPQVNELTVSALSELLGVQLTGDDIPAGGGLQGNAEKARAIGAKLHELLIAEFAPGGTVTPESGERAARAFTGFNINFAVATAFNTMFGELFSLGAFKELGDVGIEIAQNLGLGRLHRGALKPLIDNTVAKPYDKLLRNRYRPDSLTEAQFVKALARGTIQESEVREHLANKGYPNPFIDEIIAQLTAHLSHSELELLVRHGEMSQADALAQLKAEGFPEAVAQQKLRAQELAKVDTIVDSLIGKYRHLVEHRFMDTETFNTLISGLPISESQKVWEIRLAGAPLDFPHKRITLAQLFKMEEDGILDLSYFDEWCKAEGYSDDDTVNLQLLLFKTEQDIAAKAAAAKKKADAAAAKAAAKKIADCAKLTAKGLPCPP